MDEIYDIDVIVRVDTSDGEPRFVAVMPGEAGTYDVRTCAILDEIEGHGVASMQWWQQETRAPYPSEHARTQEFLAWVESFGYRIRRMRKATSQHYANRLSETRHA